LRAEVVTIDNYAKALASGKIKKLRPATRQFVTASSYQQGLVENFGFQACGGCPSCYTYGCTRKAKRALSIVSHKSEPPGRPL
jgi:hypothetical protein